MNRFRYTSHNFYSLLSQSKSPLHPPTLSPQTLVSLDPSSIDFSHSNQFHANSSCSSIIQLVSSSGSSSGSALASSFPIKFRSLHLYRGGCIDKGLLVNVYLVKNQRCYGTSSSVKCLATYRQVNDIIGMIRRLDTDLESKLCSMNVSINLTMFKRIFEVLNRQKTDALALCDWIRFSHPSCRNDVRSMLIDNLGRLGKFDAMSRVLSEFATSNVSLYPSAFQFVSLSPLKEDTVRKVVEILKAVRDPTRSSGLCALIQAFSAIGSFDMAEFVMELSWRKEKFYNIMMKVKCEQGDFEGAVNMFGVMREYGCEPDSRTYNYLLSNLCKHGKSAEATALFEEMLEMKCDPDPITYEIFVCQSFQVGNFDLARKLVDRMNVQGITPRISVHAAIVKGYFNLKRFDEAYQYVMACDKYTCFPVIYSILARLYAKANQVIVAHNLLSELINRGLKPDQSVYSNVFRQLIKTGRSDLAEDLRSGMSRFRSKSTLGAG